MGLWAVMLHTTMMVLGDELDAQAFSVDATEHIKFTGAVPLVHDAR